MLVVPRNIHASSADAEQRSHQTSQQTRVRRYRACPRAELGVPSAARHLGIDLTPTGVPASVLGEWIRVLAFGSPTRARASSCRGCGR
jgi:hypothetical protein